LWAGAHERTVSTAVSGVVGMVTFQALAMFVYALSRDAVLAVAAPIVIVVSRAAEFGVIYPIFLTPTTHTYGVLGLSSAVLAAALLGSGCWRPGLFLLGLLPAIHPSIAAWTLLIVVIAGAWGGSEMRLAVAGGWRWFAAGAAVSAASFAVHVAMAPPGAGIAASDAARYLSAFTLKWDGHRQPVPVERPGVMLNVAGLILSAVWLKWAPAVETAAAKW